MVRRLTGTVGTAWSMCGLCLLTFVVVEGGLRLSYAIYDGMSTADSEVADQRVQAPGYANLDWKDDYSREFSCTTFEWHPYVYWRRKPFEGRIVNVSEQGLRKTWAPAPEFSKAMAGKRIWMFGGLAMWSTGARDDFAIPSQLAKLLVDSGKEVDITNYGESGYVATQELVSLMLALRSGKRPDLVVLYDGVNDVFSAYQHDTAGEPSNEFNRRREFNLRDDRKRLLVTTARGELERMAIQRLARGIRRRLDSKQIAATTHEEQLPSTEPLADAVVESYKNTLNLARVGKGIRLQESVFLAAVAYQP